MSALAISNTTAALNWSVTMIGDGRDRGAATTWYVDTTPNPYVWDELPFEGWDATFDGFKWGAANQTQRWGTNVISDPGVTASYGYGDVSGFKATFDSDAGDNEAIGASGDSGGAVFYNDGTSWQLAGVILARTAYSGQPDSTSVFSNATFAADLSVYRDQIVSLVPEPATLSLLALGSLVFLCRSSWRRTGGAWSHRPRPPRPLT